MDACIYDAAEIWSPTDQQKTSRFQELHAPLVFNDESFQNAKYPMKRAPSSEMPQKTRLFLAGSGEVGVKQLASLSLS